MKRLAAIVVLLAAVTPALAHHAPNSFVRLEFRSRSVLAQVLIPQSELAWAVQGTPPADVLPAYLLQHVGATTPQGAAWTVKVANVRATTYLEQPYFVAELELLPPAGASTRDFVLTDDAVTHEVRNHVVFVVATRDYADAALETTPELIGGLQYPARQLAIRRPVIAAGFSPDRRPARAPER